MANFIKIGHTFLNLDRVLCVEDRFGGKREDGVKKEDKIIIRFSLGGDEHDQHVLLGRDADDLRTWLNSIATNLHEVNGMDAEA